MEPGVAARVIVVGLILREMSGSSFVVVWSRVRRREGRTAEPAAVVDAAVVDAAVVTVKIGT